MAEYIKFKVPAKQVSETKGVGDLIEKAEEEGVKTAWHRFLEQQPQCGFGLLGVCCRNCNMGPCRIDPFGAGPTKGVCGADADTIVARNILRMIAAGAAAHSDHARDIVHVFKGVATGEFKGYRLTDVEKLKGLAQILGIDIEGKSESEIASEVAHILELEFGKPDDEPLKLLVATAPKKRIKVWERLGVMPRAIDREICECMHRTHMGVDADPASLLLHGVRTALADGWSGSMMATYLSDILFGTPKPIKTTANLGVLKEDYVNIIVHGHNPILSMKIAEVAQSEEMQKLAKKYGAKGVNVAGMCCTGNEVLVRLGISPAGNFLMQELAIITGAVEAMVVDYQCLMPSLIDVAGCYHTKIITTEPKAHIPGAVHIEFKPERADEIAKEIVKIAIENFQNRPKERVYIPKHKSEVVAGFSVEAILEALGGTLEPLINALREGTIKGIVGVVGCNNPKVKHNHSHVTLTKELIKRDILVVGTGCWGIAAAMGGLLTPEAAKMAGDGLRAVCETLGIPPCLHMGSCVDCSRILIVLGALAEALGVDIPDLPVAGSAPEWMSEKAVSIGTYFVASGVFTHLGVVPPVLGSQKVTRLLTDDIEDLLGGKFYVEPDPVKAAETIYNVIIEKRKKLKWPV
ncbi:anaerobic carbon-monoxide dehydrogenase catalytic subunit [Thermococcus sp. SY098]|uniref:anaerobic carbon-monoxide dehydrogenase catalytic subunit n=1 Tax=Thermococcus sp. SY098 TaxID=3111325 RepID=UPI002D79B562|nr:anaerobic carbon-monoxide dehydrogenase catalytic subunit [Thermococcus sp. SY098]WRS53269.1 anaerobic carbon-monoxide dehydrogenase catalytic subunit [Thermococcus sp. SY098]